MRSTRPRLALGAAVLAAALVLSACGGGGTSTDSDDVDTTVDGEGRTLTLWHYENETSAMGVAWKAAIEKFEKETGAKVEYENKAFEQIRTTASQVLNSDKAPDVMEYNKGNATAGLLASQGLLTNLDGAVEAYEWEDKLAPSLQTTATYDSKGVMGSGSYFGIPNYGEYVEFYYNEDLFKKHGVEVPTTFEELEEAMAAFEAKGVTPLAESAAEYPLGQLWYQLALTKADRDWVDSYQTYTDKVDFSGPEISYATETIKDWTEKGYISENATGLKAEDAGVSFINGAVPMFFSGSWWYGRFVEEAKFNWSTGLFPGAEISPGSSGNVWVVPTQAKEKDLAYKFIDITMSPEIQNLMGNHGGVPVAAEPEAITDEKSKELIANFNTLTEQDGLGFYPDWPTPTFYDELNAGLQEVLNGTKTPDEVNEELGGLYQDGVDSITGGS